MQMIYEWDRLPEPASLSTQAVIVLRITELRMRLFRCQKGYSRGSGTKQTDIVMAFITHININTAALISNITFQHLHVNQKAV